MWVTHPDWRLGQLIENAIAVASHSEHTHRFYVEDEALEAGLDRL